MNKLLFVLLAICLLNVHAFVRRDTEAVTENWIEDFQKQFQTIAKNIDERVSKVLDAEEIKKNFNAAVDSLQKVVKDLKATTEGDKDKTA